jgi:hypothetical protein
VGSGRSTGAGGSRSTLDAIAVAGAVLRVAVGVSSGVAGSGRLVTAATGSSGGDGFGAGTGVGSGRASATLGGSGGAVFTAVFGSALTGFVSCFAGSGFGVDFVTVLPVGCLAGAGGGFFAGAGFGVSARGGEDIRFFGAGVAAGTAGAGGLSGCTAAVSSGPGASPCGTPSLELTGMNGIADPAVRLVASPESRFAPPLAAS